MKTCTKCKIEKDIKEFYSDKQKKDGLSSHCKNCKNVVIKQYTITNNDLVLERKRKYYQKNVETFKIKSVIYRQEHREEIKKRKADYLQKNKHKIYPARSLERTRKRKLVREQLGLPETMFVCEEYCRAVFERIFGKPFKKSRPNWLVNPVTKCPLELDGLCEDELIAFEYNGVQHYQYHERFHNGSHDEFEYQKYKDDLKRKKCEEHGIYLVVIPYTENTKSSIDTYIIQKINDYCYNATIEDIIDIPFKAG